MKTLDTQKTLSNTLITIQKLCIGLYLPHYCTKPEDYQLIIEMDEAVIISVSVGTLFGLYIEHTPIGMGTIIMFPDGKTLWEMMEEPVAFDDWWKLNCK